MLSSFSYQVPMDLDVKHKALMIGAVFVIVSSSFHTLLFCFTITLSVSRALSAMDTLRSFKRCGAKGVNRQMSYQGIT